MCRMRGTQRESSTTSPRAAPRVASLRSERHETLHRQMSEPTTPPPNDLYARARARLIEQGVPAEEADAVLSWATPVGAGDEPETEAIFYPRRCRRRSEAGAPSRARPASWVLAC
jgi:hypothetical protein